jgi:hypothetical protein
MDAWDWNEVQKINITSPVLWLDSYGDIVNDDFNLPFGKHILLDLND